MKGKAVERERETREKRRKDLEETGNTPGNEFVVTALRALRVNHRLVRSSQRMLSTVMQDSYCRLVTYL